ncbi:MAG TPA: hypothetical protein VFT65_01510, partial [Candidatus Angelobacter sp.]|nr:hypothetical protein [Candidatus Angelobacter sp.]
MLRSQERTTPVVILLAFILLGLCGCGSGSVSAGGNNNGTSQAVIAFALQSSTIVQGQSTTLTWKVTNGATFSISPAVGNGTLPLAGSA